MNIVIFSYNFFPQADAESFCATRFASALARAGHNVTVVTMDWDMQVSAATYDALVADGMRIVRVPFSNIKNSPIKALLWYGHNSQMAVDVKACAREVTKVLKSLDSPILVTRTHPVMSAMVGLRTYKYANRWIAHFSDPIPWMGYADTIGHRLLKRLEVNILSKTFRKADLISVTCHHVCRYFKDIYGKSFDENKVCVTTHIGDYRISPKSSDDIGVVSNLILHPGSIFADRGGAIIPQVMSRLLQSSVECKFVQVGSVDNALKNVLVKTDNIEIYDTISVEKSIELKNSAKAIFVPDFESEYPYSPFILSKFVYHIMEDKVIVLYSKKDCEMRDYAINYPEAGIIWAEMGNRESLQSAIIKAMKFDNSKIDRTRIRKCFAEETIVQNFEKALKRILN